MSELRTFDNPFQFTGHDVRTAIDDKGNAWFCAKDVFEALDVVWNGSGISLRNHSEKHIYTIQNMGQRGSGDLIFIAEPSVYMVLFRSNKPEAQKFRDWVFEEVLPSIRKTGSYGKLSTKDYIAVIKEIASLEARLTGTKNAFTRKLLTEPLRNLCNMAGHPMPNLELIAIEVDQKDLFELEVP